MNGLHAALDDLVRDVPEYGDLDRAIAEAERDRRRRNTVVAGLVAAAAALIVIAGTLVLAQSDDAAPPPVTPSPTPPPPAKPQAPGPGDHPVALLEADGGLLLATLAQTERPGTATLWRNDAGGWQQVGTVDDVVPLHMKADSHGSRLRTGPGRQDLYLSTSAFDGVQFSRDGGATWRTLPNPDPCRAECFIFLYDDYFYARGDWVGDSELDVESSRTLSRAAFGTTTWEDIALPPASGGFPGYMDFLVLEDGSLVIEEAGGCEASATGHYRVSRDHGNTWSERRALPGSSSCISGTRDNVLYAECSTTACYYDTGGNGSGEGTYRTTDLANWKPNREPVPHHVRYGNPVFAPIGGRCPAGLGDDPVYHWVEEPVHRVGDRFFKLFHVPGSRGHEHTLMVSRDDCRTWKPAYRQSSGS